VAPLQQSRTSDQALGATEKSDQHGAGQNLGAELAWQLLEAEPPRRTPRLG
jgi:hypothetical protein